jgi:uncharacterized circularly permuted ATP-grasp superfamily protein
MFEQYEIDGLYDEMFAAAARRAALRRRRRPAAGAMGHAAFSKRVRMADLTFRNQGITFTVYKDGAGVEKIFPFDLIPRIVPAGEWDVIERGLVQRLTALNMFCHDVYHGQRILKEKVIPPELIYGAKMFSARCST